MTAVEIWGCCNVVYGVHTVRTANTVHTVRTVHIMRTVHTLLNAHTLHTVYIAQCVQFPTMYAVHIYIYIIGIQPLGWSGQRPELSQSTGIALVRCILGKFLGVVCHCFPPRLDVPTFATRCLSDARDPSGGRWNCGRECILYILCIYYNYVFNLPITDTN